MSILEGLEIESCATDGRVRARRVNALKVVNDSPQAWEPDLRRVARAAPTQAGSLEGVLNRTTFNFKEQMTYK